MSSTTETPGTWFSLRPNGQAIILRAAIGASLGFGLRSKVQRQKQARDSKAGDAEADAEREEQTQRRQRQSFRGGRRVLVQRPAPRVR